MASGTSLTLSNSGLANSLLTIVESTDGTSNRAGIQLGAWVVGQDIYCSGTRDFFIYGGAVPEVKLYIATSGNIGLGTLSTTAQFNLSNDFFIAANSGAWNAPGKGLFMRYSTASGQDSGHIQSIDRSTGTSYPLYFEAQQYLFSSSNAPRLSITTLGEVGIGTSVPSSKLTINATTLHSNAFNHAVSPLTVTQPTATSATVLNDPQPVLHLTREGTAAQAFGARATFALSRYENNGYNSRTRLDIQLSQDSYDTVNVMSFRGNGNVGIGLTAPSTKLHLGGNSSLNDSILTLSESTHASSRRAGIQWGDWIVGQDYGAGGTKDFFFYGGSTATIKLYVGTGGNIGVGTAAPNGQLQLSNSVQNRKIVLWELANNEHECYGLGVNSFTFRYQVPTTTSSHVFYAASSSSNSNELFRISGAGTATITGATPTLTIATTSATGGSVYLGNSSHGISRDGGNNVIVYTAGGSGGIALRANGIGGGNQLFVAPNGTISRAVPNFGRWTAGASGVPTGVWTTIAGWGGSFGTGEGLTLYLNQAFVNNLGRAVAVSFTYSGKKNSNNFGLTSVRIMTSQTNGADATNWAQCDQGATDNVAITAQVYVNSGYQLYVQAFQDSGSGNDFIDNRLAYIVS